MNQTLPPPARALANDAGLALRLTPEGALREAHCRGVMLNLFPATAMEAGPGGLWLRRHAADGGVQAMPLTGPDSPLAPAGDGPRHAEWAGMWQGLQVRLRLQLHAVDAAWCWHVGLAATADAADAAEVDLVLLQDVGLADEGAIRTNEYYVSHYIDLAALQHPRRGAVLAARQNQPVQGRHPWLAAASLRRAVSYATDALQVFGAGWRASGVAPAGVRDGLPGTVKQHEHALIALQDERLTIAPGHTASAGFVLLHAADHPAATSAADLGRLDPLLAWAERVSSSTAASMAVSSTAPEATSAATPAAPASGDRSLFASAPWLAARDLTADEITAHFGPVLRHAEHDVARRLLSFHCGEATHVVLRAKELAVQRPHGHLLRAGVHQVPDERALTSTVWMSGVFHSMLTQGHASINRMLSAVRSSWGLYRSQGLRVFVELGGAWQQLGVPSAFAIQARRCRWFYRHAAGLLEVESTAGDAPAAVHLSLHVREGEPLRWLVTHHIALDGQDGQTDAPAAWTHECGVVRVAVPAGSALAERLPGGSFSITAAQPGALLRVGGDEALFADGRRRGLPWLCVQTRPCSELSLRLSADLLAAAPPAQHPAWLRPRWTAPAGSPLAGDSAALADIVPWYEHNALVHYLSPRGLEQYTGGGWGVRDVCQGPLEMLLALNRPAPVRQLLCTVFGAQNTDGDWPQWFMFFERDRAIRAGDSHGDIVFWPLLALARYLLSTDDASLLDEPLPYRRADGTPDGEGTLWQHVERALAVIHARRIPGTALAAYGHGDWNDSLQPADPRLREHLCSAWTVTLHYQSISTLAEALERLELHADAAHLREALPAIERDFHRLLVQDGIVAGYALFEPTQPSPELLLHPQDQRTGVHYSLLPMMHAVLAGLLSPSMAHAQLAAIHRHLMAPDGARLFDRPLPYRGGPAQLFQRAETSAFFGREIGVMYMHAHLRYAETLACLGLADAFFAALNLAHPIGLAQRVPSASLRQANCYYSSSDAAFGDRYRAAAGYDRIADGRVALDGGWRVYSSGPGIALGLVVGHFLGVRHEARHVLLDPVMPPALDGLEAEVEVAGRPARIRYRVGPQGCGVRAVGVNVQGQMQVQRFTRAPHPYRTGAAVLALDTLRGLAAAAGGRLELEITLG
ncbi:hypothetical protein V4F39_09365 [Aquincola sp. MAHUQ-54]|uniref:Cellobiose phosphorylase n=1 Tax=Aquincola agrisoli TaxID=3119538 RepID=A0AAW9QEI7_9BURK